MGKYMQVQDKYRVGNVKVCNKGQPKGGFIQV